MNWKLIPLIAIILLGVIFVSGCIGDSSIEHSNISLTDSSSISENGLYYSVNDVGAYLIKYHKLPKNYITKDEAHSLGWHGGSIEKVVPGMAIGGDVFTNRQEILPTDKAYKECDIDTNGKDVRGAKRIVYSTDYKAIYYTEDHYESFTKLN